MSQPPRGASQLRRVAFFLLLAALFTLGCGVKIPVVSLYDGPAARPASARTGVVTFADERPEVQRDGHTPWLVPLIFFNWRRGVTAAVADALGDGRYGPAQLLAGEPTGDRREAADRCRSVGLQYGAVGTVEQLYGSVDQNAYLFVFPIPFLWLFGFRNDKSDPLGVIDLQFEIFECQTGKVVYRRRLHGQQRYPKQTPSDAVRLTLRDVLEQLANETRSP
jgi:hypothetical protein